MGVMKLLLLLLVLFNFTSPLSFASNYSEKSWMDESSTFIGSDNNKVVNQSKFAHASGVGGGHSIGGSNTGNVGASSSSRRGGGGGVIPIYVASGATAKSKNHHNAAKTSRCRKDRLLIIIATTILVHVYMT